MTECPDKPESSPGRFRLVLRALAPENWLDLVQNANTKAERLTLISQANTVCWGANGGVLSTAPLLTAESAAPLLPLQSVNLLQLL